MENTKTIKAYKGFNLDMTCNGFQTSYAVGVVDGKMLMPDTWYTVIDGKFKEG